MRPEQEKWVFEKLMPFFFNHNSLYNSSNNDLH